MNKIEYISKKLVLNVLNRIGGCDATDEWAKGWDKAIDTVIDKIEKMPVINDVTPIRHGHWNVGYFHDRVCSCCCHPDNDLSDFPHPFCPNCGAEMRGEHNDP